MWIRLNSYTQIRILNRKPIKIGWNLSEFVDPPKDNELAKEAEQTIAEMGWKVRCVDFRDEDGCRVATLEIK